MKKRIARTLTVMITVFGLLVTPQLAGEVKAKEIDTAKNITSVDLSDMEMEAELDLGQEKSAEKELPQRNGGLVAGTVSDYLGATGAYVIYPIALTSGEYFQAQLTVPNNANIDYDVYLLDANGNVLCGGDSETYINGVYGTLPEAMGYISPTSATYYIYVLSSLGGSATDPYTLDYSVSSSYDTDESDESYHEMINVGTIGNNGYTINTRDLNSPVDNDWYDFIVPSNASYDQLIIEANTASANTCKVELYQNVSSNWYQMSLISTGVPYSLSAGEYYLRISNEVSMVDFDDNDIQNYTLSIRPVKTASSVSIDTMSGTEGIKYVTYSGYGTGFRTAVGTVTVSGKAYDSNHNPCADVPVEVTYYNPACEGLGVNDWISRSNTTYTDSNGNYSVNIVILYARGIYNSHVTVSTHYFDICSMNADISNNPSAITDEEDFFLFSHSVLD